MAELRASLGLENIIGQKRPAKKTAPEPVPQAPAIVEQPQAEQKADAEDELEAFLRSQRTEPEPVAQPVAAPVPAEPVDELAAFLAQNATEPEPYQAPPQAAPPRAPSIAKPVEPVHELPHSAP